MSPTQLRSIIPARFRRSVGFTLLEMLSVVTVFLVLLAIAGDMVRGDRQRSFVNSAMAEMEGMLELARWEARSKSTYVWLCLRPVTGGTDSGVEVVLFASKDGTSNSSADNLISVTPKRLLRGIRLPATSDSTPGRLRSDYGLSSIDEAETGRVGGSNLTINVDPWGSFQDTMVCFNSRGEPSIPGQQLPGFLEVVISPLPEGPGAEAKSSAILVSRSTGAVRAFR